MSNETLAKATIASALISRGQFPSLDDLDELVQKDAFDWRQDPAFLKLRRVTDAMYRALDEPVKRSPKGRAPKVAWG